MVDLPLGKYQQTQALLYTILRHSHWNHRIRLIRSPCWSFWKNTRAVGNVMFFPSKSKKKWVPSVYFTVTKKNELWFQTVTSSGLHYLGKLLTNHQPEMFHSFSLSQCSARMDRHEPVLKCSATDSRVRSRREVPNNLPKMRVYSHWYPINSPLISHWYLDLPLSYPIYP